MKLKILLLLLWVCLCFHLNNISAQSANIKLSNLTAPTSVNQNLLPDSNNTINLGSVSKSWRVLYIDNSIYLKDSMFLHNKGVQNTFVGNQAGFAITSGNNNAGFGYRVLFSNNKGKYNTASGSFALYNNTAGNNNTASGAYALYQNVAGSLNTATGIDALYNNDAGGYNTATGAYALLYNTGGTGNVGTGINALLYNTRGNNNTATGTNALYYNVYGYSNVAIGVASLFNNTAATNNVAIGDSSLYNNNFNDYITYHGDNNTAVGSKSLYSNTTGYENTAMGTISLYYNADGYWNTSIGGRTMEYNTSGYENTAIGFSALAWNATGNFNTSLGAHDSYSVDPAFNNNTSIGYNAQTSASNAVRIGNSSVTSIGGQVGWTNFSDERIKSNIKENVPGLAFIKLLRPVTYNFSLAKENDLAGIKNDTAKWKTKYDIEKVNFTGFLAQEVFTAAKKINYDFSGVDQAGKIWGLRYGDFVVPLVKAVQELSAKNDSLQKQNNDFERRIERLESMMNDLKSTINNTQSAVVPAAMLDQNIPNPFINNTIINYTLPQKFASAQIVFTDKNGRTLKAISVSGSGKSTLNVDASTLAAGAYQYSLVIDGKLVISKQMIVAK